MPIYILCMSTSLIIQTKSKLKPFVIIVITFFKENNYSIINTTDGSCSETIETFTPFNSIYCALA